jgi:hypothetical protein
MPIASFMELAGRLGYVSHEMQVCMYVYAWVHGVLFVSQSEVRSRAFYHIRSRAFYIILDHVLFITSDHVLFILY